MANSNFNWNSGVLKCLKHLYVMELGGSPASWAGPKSTSAALTEAWRLKKKMASRAASYHRIVGYHWVSITNYHHQKKNWWQFMASCGLMVVLMGCSFCFFLPCHDRSGQSLFSVRPMHPESCRSAGYLWFILGRSPATYWIARTMVLAIQRKETYNYTHWYA